ncbi:hypothetical protein [Streptodolium elevatio]|uniref:Large polyvalent protein-associated domain-containing protein n=1 Tax=Streptodolium elevatio TaxID=3157996 RepID=A0ABV3DCY3_9ACTN
MTWRESARYHLWKWVGIPTLPTTVADPALRAARTVDEVVHATQRGLSAATGRNVALERSGSALSAKTLREFSDGMLLAVRRHGRVPLDALEVGSLPREQLAFAGANVQCDTVTAQLTHCGGHITLNESRFRPGARFGLWMGARGAELGGLGRTRRLRTPQAAGAHELAHVVDALMAHPEWKQAGVMPDHPQSLREQVAEMVGERRGKPAGQVTPKDVAAELGVNAAGDFDGAMNELVADADADVSVNKEKAHPINQKVAERLAQAKEPFVPGPGARLQEWRGREHTRSVTGVEHWFPDVNFPVAPTPGPVQRPAPETGPGQVHAPAPRGAVRTAADGTRAALVDPAVLRAPAAGLSSLPVIKPRMTPQRQSPTAVNTSPTLDAVRGISPYKAVSERQLSREKFL